ncbi:hypothetical protein LJC46_07875 [Desulfovibrio sp. OttesenSCG-928-G15]|nr:hypothetical protein [Desulfovibrio sp. OttesenSCG-928-G15]
MLRFVQGLLSSRKHEEGPRFGKGRGRRSYLVSGGCAAGEGREGRRARGRGCRRDHREMMQDPAMPQDWGPPRHRGMLQDTAMLGGQSAGRQAGAREGSRFLSVGVSGDVLSSEADLSGLGQCSLCEKNCLLESPGCGKGAALAKKIAQEMSNGKY